MTDSPTATAPFAPVLPDDWRARVEADLGEASFEQRLVTRTREGLEVQPLHDDRTDSGATLARSGPRWERHEELDAGDIDAALARLERARRFGIDAVRVRGGDAAGLTRLLQRARELGLAVHLEDGQEGRVLLSAGVEGGLGLPPRSVTEELAAGWREAPGELRLARASAARAEERGAGEALQLAIVLAEGAAWLRRAVDLGLSVDEADAALELEVGLGTDLFVEVAKLRALRLAWGRLALACGLEASAPAARIHARTSERSWTRRDPWGNALRGTTIAFAAAVGCADSLVVLPFDERLGHPDEEALRLAANTHALLEEESHLAAVDDPAAGSGLVEALTSDLAREAWARLRRIEELGGLEAAPAREWVEERIAEVAARDACEVGRRERGIVGVSLHPALDEELPVREAREQQREVEALAAPYEALRDRSDAHLASTGSRPAAFLARPGHAAETRARCGFTQSLLAAGGLTTVQGPATEDLGEIEAAFIESGARIAVLCSSDERYAELAAPLAAALTGRGATVVLAGNPGADEARWSEAGVQYFIHQGCNALGVLRQLWKCLEVDA